MDMSNCHQHVAGQQTNLPPVGVGSAIKIRKSIVALRAIVVVVVVVAMVRRVGCLECGLVL
jgi:hypothetical protein